MGSAGCQPAGFGCQPKRTLHRWIARSVARCHVFGTARIIFPSSDRADDPTAPPSLIRVLNNNNGNFGDFRVVGAEDLNGDGKSDLIWQSAGNGQVVIWFMDGQGGEQSSKSLQNGYKFQEWKIRP
jgi:hypothetical protein